VLHYVHVTLRTP